MKKLFYFTIISILVLIPFNTYADQWKLISENVSGSHPLSYNGGVVGSNATFKLQNTSTGKTVTAYCKEPLLSTPAIGTLFNASETGHGGEYKTIICEGSNDYVRATGIKIAAVNNDDYKYGSGNADGASADEILRVYQNYSSATWSDPNGSSKDQLNDLLERAKNDKSNGQTSSGGVKWSETKISEKEIIVTAKFDKSITNVMPEFDGNNGQCQVLTNKSGVMSFSCTGNNSCNSGDTWDVNIFLEYDTAAGNAGGNNGGDNGGDNGGNNSSDCDCTLMVFVPTQYSSTIQTLTGCVDNDGNNSGNNNGGNNGGDNVGDDADLDGYTDFGDYIVSGSCDEPIDCDPDVYPVEGYDFTSRGTSYCDKDGLKVSVVEDIKKLNKDSFSDDDIKYLDGCLFEFEDNVDYNASNMILDNPITIDGIDLCPIYCVERYDLTLPGPNNNEETSINAGTYFTINDASMKSTTKVNCYADLNYEVLINAITAEKESSKTEYNNYIPYAIALNKSASDVCKYQVHKICDDGTETASGYCVRRTSPTTSSPQKNPDTGYYDQCAFYETYYSGTCISCSRGSLNTSSMTCEEIYSATNYKYSWYTSFYGSGESKPKKVILTGGDTFNAPSFAPGDTVSGIDESDSTLRTKSEAETSCNSTVSNIKLTATTLKNALTNGATKHTNEIKNAIKAWNECWDWDIKRLLDGVYNDKEGHYTEIEFMYYDYYDVPILLEDVNIIVPPSLTLNNVGEEIGTSDPDVGVCNTDGCKKDTYSGLKRRKANYNSMTIEHKYAFDNYFCNLVKTTEPEDGYYIEDTGLDLVECNANPDICPIKSEGAPCEYNGSLGLVIKGFPVNIDTPQGEYSYTYDYYGIGHYFDTGEVGRLDGVYGIGDGMGDGIYGEKRKGALNTCIYNVNNCETCDNFCISPEGHYDDCPIDYKICDSDCENDCTRGGCIFDNKAGFLSTYRVISLNNFQIALNNLKDPSKLLALSLSTDNYKKSTAVSNWDNPKAQTVIKHINGDGPYDGERIYDDDPEYTVTLNPADIRKIRKYNEENPDYAELNGTFELKNGGGSNYYVFHASTFDVLNIVRNDRQSEFVSWSGVVDETKFVGPAYK